MSDQMTLRVLGAGVGTAGVILIGVTANWWVALGVFLIVTGNNIERTGKKQ